MRVKFGDIAINSTAKKKPVEADKDTYLGLEHLDSGNLTVTRFGSEVAPIGEKLLMRKGDVLFGKRRAYQKKVAIAPFDGIFSAHGMVLRPKTNVVTERFFPLFIASDYFLDAAIKISVGSLSPTINWSALKELEFTLPPLDEQDSLAEVLWAMIDTKNAYKRLISLTDELVKARFVEMFGNDKYKQVTLADVCNSIVRGPFGSSLKVSFFVPQGKNTYKVYEQKNAIQKSAELGDSYITADKFNELKRFECKSQDILMSCSGTIGEFIQLPEDCERGIINQALCKFTLNSRILPIVFLTYMRLAIDNLERKGSGIQNVAAVSFIKEMSINLPPLDIQHQFAAFAASADKSKLALQHTLDELDASYKALLKEKLV